MKTRKFLWAVLPMMAAALAMTACGGDDDTDTKPVPVSPTDNTDKTEKSIPYTVTVKGDPETTRATVNADGKTMNFADGDKLYVKNDGGDIHGVLFIQPGARSDAATFSGTLYYDTTNPPSESTILKATLVGKDDEVADITDGKVEDFTYPTTDNVCSTLAEAVSKYSKLTGTGNYGSAEIVLSQSTAFLKFTVKLEDGTLPPTDPNADPVPVSVRSDGSTTIGKGSVSASGSAQFTDVQAVFYVPVAGGTVISTNAKMWVGSVGTPSDESITYGASTNKQLTGGKVYTVSKTKDFVRLWDGGPVWATRNLDTSTTTKFASSVTGYGDYYCWGGTTPVTDTSFTLGWNSNCPHWKSGTTPETAQFSKYDGTPNSKTKLEASDDAATQNLGSSWRMPTGTDFDNLLSKTKAEWTTVNSINGGTFTGNTDGYTGKAIFLPAAGFRGSNMLHNQGTNVGYWSSSLDTSTSSYIYGRTLTFNSGGNNASMSKAVRYGGRSIRPVRN